jgi:hypothetical protein
MHSTSSMTTCSRTVSNLDLDELEGCLKGLVVNVFVNIESAKRIKRLVKRQVCWCVLVPIHRHEVRRSKYSIEVNNGCEMCTVLKVIRLYYPHPRVLIWGVTHARIPVYKGARICSPFVFESK